MPRWFKAGCAYFAVVFAAGFALGTIRVLLLLPRMSELAAVVLETPIILAVCWFVSGWAMRRFAAHWSSGDALLMGSVAFLLLMLAEIVLSLTVFDTTLAGYFGRLATAAGLIGLAGQLLFGLFPALRVHLRSNAGLLT